VGILVLLIATVGLLLFRVTQTETTLPLPPPVTENAAGEQIVVAKPHAPPPPPPPVQREEAPAPPPPPPVASKKKGNPKPPPRVEPPPPRAAPKSNGVIGELRGRLREVKRSRDRQAAVRLAVDIEKAGNRLPAGSKAREAISYEIGRIRFMTEVDDMIEALDQSINELGRAP
jgi:hypothetical protein